MDQRVALQRVLALLPLTHHHHMHDARNGGNLSQREGSQRLLLDRVEKELERGAAHRVLGVG